MSIFTAVHSDKTQYLLYMHDIRVGARRSVGWKQYDEQFRLKMAMDPSKSRAVVDSEIWWALAILLQFQGSMVSISAMRSIFKGFASEIHVHIHMCIKCGHEHSMLNCPMSAHPRRLVSNFSQRLPRPSGYGSPQRFRQAGPQSLSTTSPAQQFSGIWDLGHSPIRVDKISRILQDYPVREAAKELLEG